MIPILQMKRCEQRLSVTCPRVHHYQRAELRLQLRAPRCSWHCPWQCVAIPDGQSDLSLQANVSSHHLPSMGTWQSPLQKSLQVFMLLRLNFSFLQVFFSQRMNQIPLYFPLLPQWFVLLHVLIVICLHSLSAPSPPMQVFIPLSSVFSHCLASFSFHPLLMAPAPLSPFPAPVPSTPVQDDRLLPCTSPPTHSSTVFPSLYLPPPLTLLADPPSLSCLVFIACMTALVL